MSSIGVYLLWLVATHLEEDGVSVCRSRFENLMTCFSKFVSAVSCQARGAAREHKMYISPPTQNSVLLQQLLTIMYTDLVLGVYSKALLQGSC